MGLIELSEPKEPTEERVKLEQSFRSGANWFYWIAGLSVVNSVIQILGSDRSFIVGLGITQVFDAIAAAGAQEAGDATAGGVLKGVAFFLDLLVAGFFVLLGWRSGKRAAWAFVLGMVLYALDGLIFLLVQDWLSLGFHAFALFGIGVGYSSLRKLQAAEVRIGMLPIEPGR